MFWCQALCVLYERLKSSESGLSVSEAAGRLAEFGLNTVADVPHKRLFWKIGRKFAEPLVAILLVAAAISAATGDVASFGLIFIVITMSITLDVVQEQRAEMAADALKRSVAIRADVRRDGKFIPIPVDQVVPGDVVELRAGDLVPADGIVISSRNAHANEALMTGEPFPTEKRAGSCDAMAPADAFNALFAGTSLVSGEAMMLVVATGRATRFGGIAAALAADQTTSAFVRGIHRLGLLILRLTVFLVLFVLLVHLAFGRPVLETFLFAVALAVGLTPELLPMVMTVTLSRGAIRMSKRSVIVKRLAAIHDFGAMDVLCTDKTGTLTEARISLVEHTGTDGRASDRTLTLAMVNSSFSSGIRSPLDQAVVEHCKDGRIKSWKKLDEVPFDFERRSLTVLAESGSERMLIVKGAPERILALSSMIDRGDGSSKPLDERCRAELTRQQEQQASQGYRLLGVAWKPIPTDQHELHVEDEIDLVFAGYCVFVDPPKQSAADAIRRLANAGVRVKVVSGDHEAVVRHVVGELKIPANGLLAGAEIAELTDAALAARVEDTDLFARVSPDQKTRIIRALQLRGHTVGFLGDGVNDAPAIRAAEIGISVESATDVARSAADIILLDQDLGVLADGVEEGRRTFANILKYVRMGTSSNFGNMLSVALSSLVLPFLPLLPLQILLNNFLYDLSEIGIPFDRVEQREIAKPQAWDMGGILRFTLVMGALSSIFDAATFVTLIEVFHASPEEFRTAWFVESTATQILVIFIIRTSGPLLSGEPSRVLTASSLGALAVAIAVALTPIGGLFGFSAMPAPLLTAIVVIAAVYLLAAEAAKSFATRSPFIRTERMPP
nr:magnesium-translocating P-type ATPase [Rhodoplanes sp. Z2-YC6860]